MALTDEIADVVTLVQNSNGPSPLCPASPAVCRGSATSGKSTLTLKDKTVDKGDQLAWKWAGRTDDAQGRLRRPAQQRRLRVCLYDQGALLTSVTADPGGLCAGKPCWASKPTSFLYKDKELTPTGTQTLQLDEGLADGKAKINSRRRAFPSRCRT